MTKRLFIILTTCIFLYFHQTLFSHGGNSSLLVAENPTSISYEELYEQLMNLSPESQRIASINNLLLQRDVGHFNLNEGKIYLLSPIRNQIRAAFFIGKGMFSFTPPTIIEQEQLYRFYENRTLTSEFKILFMIFADTTLAEFEKKLTFGSGEIPKDLKSQIMNALEYPGYKKGKYFNPSIIKTFLDNKSNDLFYAYFKNSEFDDPLFFMIDPFEIEEVSFQRQAKVVTLSKASETICQFHLRDDYNSDKPLANEKKDLIEVNHYRIESKITEGLDFSAMAEIEIKMLVDDPGWIYFYFFPDMEVDSAFWDSGDKANFFKKKYNSTFWIQFASAQSPGEIRKLKIFYHGNVIERRDDWFYIQSSTYWYPRYHFRRSATFDLSFSVPKEYNFVSVGEKVSSKNEKNVNLSRWVTSIPIHAASFNLGIFKEYKIEDKRIPPLTVLMAKAGHLEIGAKLAQQGILSGKNMEKQVGADIANSLSFFQDVFGKTPVKNFYATEIPYLHGQAFPGLIHLAWTTFQTTDSEGYDEMFRAHEVAHQWWGIGVDFETYHDQWLSEGLAEFAGLWYMQSVLKDNKKYFDKLKRWRDDFLNNRKYLFGSGQEAGPIWLGYRTGTSTTKGDYDLIIYRKGAWIFHMLRNMMLNLQTMEEDAFINMLRDFYTTYLGKKVSTETFQKLTEKHINTDMTWFFKQWIYGTDIPTYCFAYKSFKTANDKYLVRCKIEQQNVPENFQMYIPLLIDFGDDRFARLRVLVKGLNSQIELPLMPLEPKKIIFNDLESVLCDVKNVKWKD